MSPLNEHRSWDVDRHKTLAANARHLSSRASPSSRTCASMSTSSRQNNRPRGEHQRSHLGCRERAAFCCQPNRHTADAGHQQELRRVHPTQLPVSLEMSGTVFLSSSTLADILVKWGRGRMGGDDVAALKSLVMKGLALAPGRQSVRLLCLWATTSKCFRRPMGGILFGSICLGPATVNYMITSCWL